MKFLKKIIFLLIALIGIVLVIALFVQKEYDVSRSIEISQPKDEVFDYVRYLRNQGEFAIWQKMDPKVIQKYSNDDGEVGAVYSWKSNMEDVGVGEQEITKIDLNNRIDFELRFEEPWEMKGEAYMLTENLSESEGKTRVTWGFKGRSPWPWNIFFLFMDMDSELGPDLQKGLNNLKKILESQE